MFFILYQIRGAQLRMIFSLFGEISLAVIGLLYVMDCWFDSFINMVELMKNNDNNDDKQEMSDTAKRMYS